MKMKEVCEKTGLTDRAVRLYMENGLISPDCSENYTGRRSIDFSEDDVSLLNEIALLRKASFSIAEIKELKEQHESSKEILKAVIDKTHKRIISDTEVLSCITPLLEKEELVLSDICESLKNGPVKEMEVPKEDMEAPIFIRALRNIFKAVGAVALVLNSANIINIFTRKLPVTEGLLYPRYEELVSLFAVFSLSAFLSLFFLAQRKEKKYKQKKLLIKKSVLSSLLVVILVLITFGTTAASMLCVLGSETYSSTTNAENYMIFDDIKAKEALSEFLPKEIPGAAEADYKYKYTDYTDTGIPSENQTDVFLELELYGEAFESLVEYYKSFRPKDSIAEPRTIDMGQYWTVICYREDGEEAPSNYTAFFAYSEEREEVRFICSYGNVAIKGAGIAEYILDDYNW